MLEGQGGFIHRADGSVGEIEMTSVHSEVELKSEQLNRFDRAEVDRLIDRITDDMARQQTEHAIKTFQEITEKTGQVIDGKDRPFYEVFMDAMEQLPAEPDGEQPYFVVSPQIADKIAAEKEKIESDPEVQRRMRQIDEKKEAERRARTVARRLVG